MVNDAVTIGQKVWSWAQHGIVLRYTGLTLVLLWVAFWNGYPTFYPDSVTYLEGGFLLETPVDRPLTYGLFVWATSFSGLSLWTTVFAQTLLLCATTVAFVRLFINERWWLPVLVTAVVSGVSFLGSQIMTDVFTSILIMSMVLYGLSSKHRWRWLLVYVICCAMHTSHLPVAVLMFPVLAITVKVALSLPLRSALKRTWGILPATAVAYVALNISMVKSTEAFYAAHLAETGDLQEYLNRACPKAGYGLCGLTGPIAQSADIFLWDESGAAHWYGDRDRMKKDLGKIIGDMFRDERSRRRILRSTLDFGTSQLSAFDAGEGNVPFPPGSNVHVRMQRYFGGEVAQFETMRQNQPVVFSTALGRLNGCYRIVTVLSIVVLCFCLVVMMRARQWKFAACTGFVVIAYVVNCAVNAGLVVVAQRFGAKVIWLVPLIATIGVCWLTENWKRHDLRPKASDARTSEA